jgi:LPXTG-motif cell wall-anchored protein
MNAAHPEHALVQRSALVVGSWFYDPRNPRFTEDGRVVAELMESFWRFDRPPFWFAVGGTVLVVGGLWWFLRRKR